RTGERHRLPGAGRATALPGRRQRDGAPVPLRADAVREQGRRAGREPLRNDRQGRGAAARARPAGALAGRAGDSLRRAVVQGQAPAVPVPTSRPNSYESRLKVSVSASTASAMSSGLDSSSGQWLAPPFSERTNSIAVGTPAAASTIAS